MPVAGYTPSYQNESPYRVTPMSGNYMLYYVHRPIDPHNEDILAVIDAQSYVERPDRLAQDMYGDPNLWWVFGVRNGWEDPVYDMKLHTRLYVPSLKHVRGIL